MLSAEFGFLPCRLDIAIGDIKIETLPTFDDDLKAFRACDGIKARWIHAPPAQSRDMFSGQVTTHPHRSRVFGLNKTHRISHATATSDDQLVFLVWILSFIKGIRLTTTEAGFLDATPAETHVLTDGDFTASSEIKAVGIADDFWRTHQADPFIAKTITGVMHCLYLVQMPLSMDFERFIYLYTAFDGCFAIVSKLDPAVGQRPMGGGKLPHGHRIAALCDHYKISTPAWADRNGGSIAGHRNDTLHEALFFGEPFGFRIYGGSGASHNILGEMEALLCRLLFAMLGFNDREYIESPVNTRSQFLVKLP